MNILKPMLLTLLVCASVTSMATEYESATGDSENVRVTPSTPNKPSSTYEPSSSYKPAKKHTPDSVAKEFGFKDSKDFKEWYDNQ